MKKRMNSFFLSWNGKIWKPCSVLVGPLKYFGVDHLKNNNISSSRRRYGCDCHDTKFSFFFTHVVPLGGPHQEEGVGLARLPALHPLRLAHVRVEPGDVVLLLHQLAPPRPQADVLLKTAFLR